LCFLLPVVTGHQFSSRSDQKFLCARHQSMLKILPESTRKSAMWTGTQIIAICGTKATLRRGKSMDFRGMKMMNFKLRIRKKFRNPNPRINAQTRMSNAEKTPCVRLFFWAFDRCALMIDDLPTLSSATPDCGSAGPSLALDEGVGDQVIVRSDLHAVKVGNAPDVLGWIFESLLKRFHAELPTISTTGSPDLPEFRCSHPLKVIALNSKLLTVKKGLAIHQLAHDVFVFWCNNKIRFHINRRLEVVHR
jgi:hypothetical protein